MKKIQRDHIVINYQISGHGNTTLLFVHGSYSDQTYWKEQVAYFKQHYTVVTMDLPGHGLSGNERKQWSLAGFAADVIAVIEGLHLKNVILIGHSMAGEINLMVAVQQPELILGLIAIDFFKSAGTPFAPDFEKQASQIEQNLRNNFATTNEQYARMALLTEDTPSAIAKRIVKAYRNAYQPMAMPIMHELFRAFKLEKDLLPKLLLKLYLINVDYIPTNEKLLEQYAGSGFSVRYMSGTSHYPMLENPDKLNELLEATIHEVLGEFPGAVAELH